jgi:GTPase
MISNVTGKNLPHLRTLLNCLKTSQGSERYTTEGSFEFSISDCFSVPFVGAVAVSSPQNQKVFSLTTYLSVERYYQYWQSTQ